MSATDLAGAARAIPATRTAVLSVVAAACLFGTSGTAQALAHTGAWPPAVAAARLLVGAAGLLLFVAVAQRAGAELLVLWRRPLVWLMAAAVAGYQALFFVGAARAGVAVGTLASLALAPFLAGVLGWLVGEGAPGRVWAVSTVVAVVGLVLLTVGGDTSRDGLGVLAALGAGASYAGYTVIGSRVSRSGFRPSAVLAASFSLAAVALLPVLVLSGTWWATPTGLALVLWLGLVATTVAYLLFGVGLAVLQPGHIATLNLAEPVMATLLGVLVLGEELGARGALGCVLVVVALSLLGFAGAREPGVVDVVERGEAVAGGSEA